MISFVSGILAAVNENRVEIDHDGIGFEVFVPTTVLERMPGIDQPVRLYTYMNVKEDEISLYGFMDRDALELFRKLITVSGIGPKGALSILSAFTPSDLRFAILAGDAKTLSKAPGIGAKTAQRLCIELKDKVTIEESLGHINDEVKNAHQAAENSARSEAILALTALGYSNSDALKAVSGIDIQDMDVEDILKAALKNMGR